MISAALYKIRSYLLSPVALTLLFFFVSGACGLIYQVVWVRQLALLIGVTAHAISTVLAVFFLGLGAGSMWGGRVADRSPRPMWLYGLYELGIGAWGLLLLLILGRGHAVLLPVLRLFASSPALAPSVRAALAAALLLMPVLLMDATLPLLARFVARDARMRSLRIGALYMVNTAGAVSGCLAAGFLLLPELGFMRTTLIAAALNICIGVAAVLCSRVWESRNATSCGVSEPEKRFS